MINSSKYETIIKNVVADPGRVGMEKCSFELICFKLGTGHLVFWWGEELFFSNS